MVLTQLHRHPRLLLLQRSQNLLFHLDLQTARKLPSNHRTYYTTRHCEHTRSHGTLGTCSPFDSVAARASPDAGASGMLGAMPIICAPGDVPPLLTAWQLEHRRTLARLGCLAPCQSSAPQGTCSPFDNVAARTSPDAGASRRTMAPCQSACAFGLASWGSIVKKNLRGSVHSHGGQPIWIL